MKGTILKRGNTYSYIVDIGKDPQTGKRKQKTKGGFQRKKDAEAALRKVIIELDENRYHEPSKESFASYISRWFFEHYQKRIKDSTVSARWYMIEKHLINENPFSEKKLSSITTKDIDDFYNKKIAENFSTNYIRKMHQILNQSLSQAVKWQLLAFNPVIDSDPPSAKKDEIKIWSFEEIHSFLNVCKKEQYYLLFLLAFYTGMRRGELLGLKWRDINIDKRFIQVERSLSYIPKKGYLLTTLKTLNSKRKVPIPEIIIDELLIHKKNQNKWKYKLNNQYFDNDLVICTETGSFLDPRNVLRVMKRICKAANLKPIRFHDIRHTHASILISSGVDLVKVSARLGHANPKITLETYAHLIPNDFNEVADIFHNAIQQSKKR
ncbi:tyrosine-type recombinase/integrase [Bacillus salitolerans]|uniref:Tyrosine-type recombinase/integrase n=1 Tax=Bacillus salitolerans TaxID=1437434 RepID=A0ABW4LLS0_9BACI